VHGNGYSKLEEGLVERVTFVMSTHSDTLDDLLIAKPD